MEPFSQAAPADAPRFDSASRSWTLSRYADVQAALREPALSQSSPQGECTGHVDPVGIARMHAGVQADIDCMTSVEWRTQMVNLATAILDRCPRRQPVNLVREVIQPWSSAVMLSLSGADATALDLLSTAAGRLFFNQSESDGVLPGTAADGESSLDAFVERRRKQAEADFDHLRESGRVGIGKSMFFGVTQTLPSFLAKAWLALLLHPEQMCLLRDEPQWMPNAVEELLRFAGIVHTLHRRATKAIVLGDLQIAAGNHIALKLESANRDPVKFESPERLDITRRTSGNAALGMGPHACPGAVIVRMAVSRITPIFLAADPSLEAGGRIVWTGDTSLRWPMEVQVEFGEAP
jgi:cytochrome P450